MKVLGIGRTGITVQNMERSLEFYVGVLGFKVIDPPCEMVEDQAESTAIGVPGCFHRICLLEVCDGQCIELVEFDRAPSPIACALPLNQLGQHHISYVIDDMEEWVAKFKDLKLGFFSEYMTSVISDGSTVRWLLVKDPDGVVIELIQKNVN